MNRVLPILWGLHVSPVAVWGKRLQEGGVFVLSGMGGDVPLPS